MDSNDRSLVNRLPVVLMKVKRPSPLAVRYRFQDKGHLLFQHFGTDESTDQAEQQQFAQKLAYKVEVV